MRNTQWEEFLSLRQPLALEGGEDETHLYVKIVSVVDKVHHFNTSWEGDVLPAAV